MGEVDFGEVEAWEPSTTQILPVGEFECVIDHIEAGVSSGNHDQVEVHLRDVSGQGTIKDWAVGPRKIKGLIEASPVPAPTGRVNIGPDDQQWQEYLKLFVGKRVGVVVREEEKFGEPGTMVSRVRGYVTVERLREIKGGKTGNSNGAQASGGFADAFSNTGAQPAAAAGSAGSSSDDDIPF
jgi:hypothetical protein